MLKSMGSGGASSVLFLDRPMQPDQIRAREKGTDVFQGSGKKILCLIFKFGVRKNVNFLKKVFNFFFF